MTSEPTVAAGYRGPSLLGRVRRAASTAVYRVRHRLGLLPDGNLVAYAKHELSLIGADADDEMQRTMNRHVLHIVRQFEREGHSGFSASYAIGQLERLLRFEPLTPLTGADDEWNEVGEGRWQNRRCGRVFKDADGEAYDIDGKVFVEPDGSAYTSRDSRVRVKFPYRPKTRYVKRKPVTA